MQALIFRHLSHLVEFITAFEHDLSFSQTVSLWGVKTVDHQESYLVLTNYSKCGLLKKLDLRLLEGRLDEITKKTKKTKYPRVKLTLSDDHSFNGEVYFARHKVNIQTLLPLKKWLKGPPEKVTETPVIFWVKNQSLATEFVIDHFKIGSDHIDYMLVEREQTTSFLFRVHHPSYYLIQRYDQRVQQGLSDNEQSSKFNDLFAQQALYSAQQAHEVSVYYRFKDNVYLEWGFEPILSQRWLDSIQHDSQRFSLLSNRLIVEPLTFPNDEWSSIYELTSFELGHRPNKDWQITKGHDLHFKIPLSLELRSRAVDSELWLVNADDFDSFEHKLSLVDEEDLENLLISVQEKQESTHQTAVSELRFFVRERSGKSQKTYLDIGGQCFASYMGFHNLFLPVDIELQPRLRRDQYPKLFGLQHNQITVLSLSREGDMTLPTLDQATLYHFSNQSFEPVGELVNYIIKTGSAQLEKVKKQSRFSLEKYQKVPSLLAEPRYTELKNLLMPLQVKARGAKQANELAPSTQLKKNPQMEKENEQALSTQKKDHHQDVTSSKESTLPTGKVVKDPHKKKDQLETQVSQLLSILLSDHGQKLATAQESWFELAQVLQQLKQYRSALEALTETIWLSRMTQGFGQLDQVHVNSDHSSQQYRHLFSELVAAQFNSQDQPTAFFNKTMPYSAMEELIKDPVSSHSYHAASYYFIQIEALPDEQKHEPLSHLLELVQIESLRWRKKERWLLALGMARLTQDQRLLARYREKLLNELNANGVERRDLPDLVIEHLFRARTIKDTSKNIQNSPLPIELDKDLLQGLSYLELLKSKLIGPEAPQSILWLQGPLLALMARTFHEYQLLDQRNQALDELYPLLNQQAPTTKSWILMLLTRTKGLVNTKRMTAYTKLYGEVVRELSTSDQEQLKAVIQNLLRRNQQQRARERSEISRNQTKGRLFLSFKPEKEPEIQTLFSEFVDSLHRSESRPVQEKFNILLRELIQWARPEDDHQLLAYYLHQINELAGKVKWLVESNIFIDLFAELDKSLKANLQTSTHSPFFINLCFLTLSELQLRLGNQQFAQHQIEWLLKQLNEKSGTWLDYLDSSSMALQSIESVSYHARMPLLEMLITNLVSILDQHGMQNNIIVCNFIEQIVEVSMSQDQLIANRFQDYSDHEELSLRDALFNDRL